MPALNQRNATTFLGLYLLFSLTHFVAIATTSETDNLLTKPFLMIWLGAYAYLKLRPVRTRSAAYLLAGIACSLLGDTLLMFADDRPGGGLFFLLGLGSFLLTHVAYWLAFHYWPRLSANRFSRRPLLALPFLLYWALMIGLLWPLPAGMEVPVLVYSVVIMLMGGKALQVSPNLIAGDGLMVLVGAVLFIFSDSIIAFSRFTDYLPEQPVAIGRAIMFTYLSGQLLIVLGVTRSLNAHSPAV